MSSNLTVSPANRGPSPGPRRRLHPPPDLTPDPSPPLPPLAPPGRLDAINAKIREIFNGLQKKPVDIQRPDPYADNTFNDEETVPRNTKLEIKEDDVYKVVMRHKSFSAPPRAGLKLTLTDLPALDNLEAYGVNEAQSQKLWLKEIHRLVGYVNDAEKELRFPSHTFFNEGSADAYHRLSSLADRIVDCNTIRAHDNEAILYVHCKDLHDADSYRKYQILLYRFEIDNLDDVLTDKESRVAIFALVDYVSAIFARFFCQSAYGSDWQHNCIAFLATWSTATKIISEKPSKFASISLDTAADRISKMGPLGGKEIFSVKEFSDRGVGFTGETLKGLYFAQRMRYRRLEKSLRFVLVSLMDGGSNTGTKYELCSVVYESGFEGFQTLLYRDREGELMGTSAPPCLNIAHSACAILDRIVQSVQKHPHRSTPPADPNSQSLETIIRWFYNDDEDSEDMDPGARISSDQKVVVESCVSLTSMEDIITIAVPIVITSPWIVSEVLEAVNLVALTATEDDPVQRYTATKFKAFFRIYTDLFENSKNSKGNYVSSLSRGLMTRDKLLAGPKFVAIPESTRALDGTRNKGSPPNKSLRVDAACIREANQKMNEWVFDEKAVIVQCPVYVWSVIIGASMLVIGGLAVGFTVRNRVTAVDPFNITTYCWVLAAFLVLVCKSVRVESWSWRDFLHFRVQCKSVSELRDITGVPEQLIIAKLLHEEPTTILHTRCPYNSAFKRSTDDGFSIDVPLTMWTMLLSGLIMVQVLTPQGRALACLDVRRGTKYTCVIHDNNPTNAQDRLVCADLMTSQRRGMGKKHLFALQMKKIHWTKVQGLFNMQEAEFM
ncbi:hypothetical protein K440DRAFT_658355 [Wilcoxina mikolae CBS 423.85]|nr:hypothetical protein K440DRAFT_658355 [Wilcoxina mikolae CBS 423.85]